MRTREEIVGYIFLCWCLFKFYFIFSFLQVHSMSRTNPFGSRFPIPFALEIFGISITILFSAATSHQKRIGSVFLTTVTLIFPILNFGISTQNHHNSTSASPATIAINYTLSTQTTTTDIFPPYNHHFHISPNTPPLLWSHRPTLSIKGHHLATIF